MRRINWPRSVRAGELQVNATWSDLDTHVALVIDATDDLGISEGIDGRASSLDVTVRAAGAIAEHYATRGERVSLRDVRRTDRPVGSARDPAEPSCAASSTRWRASGPGARPDRDDPRFARSSGSRMTVLLSPLISPEVLDHRRVARAGQGCRSW
jgi:uncharacterized protein (DUF58 family)